MAVDLGEHVGALRRAVTPIGSTDLDGVRDNVLLDRLLDAFWNARLDGFFADYTANDEGVIVPFRSDGPEFDRSFVSLIVLYAAVDALKMRVMSTQTKFRAKAEGVEFEQENSATMLSEMLKQLAATKNRLLDDLRERGRGMVYDSVVDAYVVRSLTATSQYVVL